MLRQNDFGSLLPSMFLGHDCLGASWASRTGQDGQTIAIDKLSIPTRAGRDLPNHRHGLPRVSKTDGKTIHHRSWKGRIVAVGGNVFCQHQAAGCRQHIRLWRQRCGTLNYEIEGFIGSDHKSSVRVFSVERVSDVF